MEMFKNRSLLIIGILFLGTLAGYFLSSQKTVEDSLETAKTELSESLDLPSVPIEEAFPHVIPAKSTLFNVLRELDITGPTIQEIVTATKPIYNLAKLNPGVRFQLIYDTLSGTQLTGLQFYFSPLEKLDIQRQNSTWIAKKIIEEVTLKTITFSGIVATSLGSLLLNREWILI
jgi:hypothetical protein